MTKYILIPEGFSGNITCYYNEGGNLMEMAINSWDMKTDDHTTLLQDMGYLLNVQFLGEFAQRNTMKVRKSRVNLTFERFWIMYGHQRNRIQAEKEWNKLSEAKRWMVLVNLKSYLRYRMNNPKYPALYPDNYLKGGHWMDNWDKCPEFK